MRTMTAYSEGRPFIMRFCQLTCLGEYSGLNFGRFRGSTQFKIFRRGVSNVILVMPLRTDKRRRACARLGLTRYSPPLPVAGFQTFGDTLRSEDDESMKPASNVKTPAQYIAS